MRRKFAKTYDDETENEEKANINKKTTSVGGSIRSVYKDYNMKAAHTVLAFPPSPERSGGKC